MQNPFEQLASCLWLALAHRNQTFLCTWLIAFDHMKPGKSEVLSKNPVVILYLAVQKLYETSTFFNTKASFLKNKDLVHRIIDVIQYY